MVIEWLRIGIRKSSIILLALFSGLVYADHECIELNWTAPTELEDGTTIPAIEKYNLKHTFENDELPIIEINGAATSYTACDVRAGVHLFELTSVVAGLESKPSNTASALIEPEVIPEPSPPTAVLITVRVIVTVEDNTTVETVE